MADSEEDQLALLLAASQSPFKAFQRPDSPFEAPQPGADTVYDTSDVRRIAAHQERQRNNPMRRGFQWIADKIKAYQDAPGGNPDEHKLSGAFKLSDIPLMVAESGEKYAGGVANAMEGKTAGHGIAGTGVDEAAMVVPPHIAPFLVPGFGRMIARGEAKPTSTYDHLRAKLQDTPLGNWERGTAQGGRAPLPGAPDLPSIWPGEEFLEGQARPHQANPLSPEAQKVRQLLKDTLGQETWPKPPAGMEAIRDRLPGENYYESATPAAKELYKDPSTRARMGAGNDAEIGSVKLRSDPGEKAAPFAATAKRTEPLPLTEGINQWLEAAGKKPDLRLAKGKNETDYIGLPYDKQMRGLERTKVRVPDDGHAGWPERGLIDTAPTKEGRMDHDTLSRVNAEGGPYSKFENLIDALKWATASSPDATFYGHNLVAPGKEPRWARYVKDSEPGAVPQFGNTSEAVQGPLQPSPLAKSVDQLWAKAGDKKITAFTGEKGEPPSRVTRIFRSLFNLEPKELAKVPNVPQVDFPEPTWAKGTPDRIHEQKLMGGENMRQLRGELKAGDEMGGRGWYNTEQLLRKFQAELGKDLGTTRFNQYMDMVSATSPGNKVHLNIRDASYRYGRWLQGEEAPGKLFKPDKGYGHKAQQLHNQNVRNIMEGGLDPLQNPKPFRFAENLKNNQKPPTVDTHVVRASNMKDSLNRPMWDTDPGPAYGYLGDMLRKLAKGRDMTPAQGQSSLWIGAGKRTGNKSGTDPFLKIFQDRVYHTANQRGLKPEEVLRRMIRGEEPLLAKAGDWKTALASARGDRLDAIRKTLASTERFGPEGVARALENLHGLEVAPADVPAFVKAATPQVSSPAPKPIQPSLPERAVSSPPPTLPQVPPMPNQSKPSLQSRIDKAYEKTRAGPMSIRDEPGFADRFWKAMDRHQEHQKKVAGELGVAQSTVNAWKKQIPRPTPQTPEAAAAAAERYSQERAKSGAQGHGPERAYVGRSWLNKGKRELPSEAELEARSQSQRSEGELEARGGKSFWDKTGKDKAAAGDEAAVRDMIAKLKPKGDTTLYARGRPWLPVDTARLRELHEQAALAGDGRGVSWIGEQMGRSGKVVHDHMQRLKLGRLNKAGFEGEGAPRDLFIGATRPTREQLEAADRAAVDRLFGSKAPKKDDTLYAKGDKTSKYLSMQATPEGRAQIESNIKKALDLVEGGMSYTNAGREVGMSDNALREWHKRVKAGEAIKIVPRSSHQRVSPEEAHRISQAHRANMVPIEPPGAGAPFRKLREDDTTLYAGGYRRGGVHGFMFSPGRIKTAEEMHAAGKSIKEIVEALNNHPDNYKKTMGHEDTMVPSQIKRLQKHLDEQAEARKMRGDDEGTLYARNDKPALLPHEREAKIRQGLDMVDKGARYIEAAREVGIDESSLRDWHKRVKAGEEVKVKRGTSQRVSEEEAARIRAERAKNFGHGYVRVTPFGGGGIPQKATQYGGSKKRPETGRSKLDDYHILKDDE